MADDVNLTKIVIFKGKQVRKILHNNEWWFVINDVVEILTDTPNVKDYVRKMRIREEELSKGWGQIVTPLSVKTEGGPQKLNCANGGNFKSNIRCYSRRIQKN